MTDPATNNVGLYDEPVPTGDADDPDSARNAPLNDPEGNLAALYWHIQFDNMEVAVDQTVTVNHAAIGTSSFLGGGNSQAQNVVDYSAPVINRALLAHGLGVEPIALVALGQSLITPGFIVESNAGGSTRCVSVHVDGTNVYLHEYGLRGTSGLAAVSKDYRVLVFRPQRVADGNAPPRLIDVDPATGLVTLGDGRWRSDRRYLQVVPGGSPFGLAIGKTLDLHNGAPRFLNPDGSYVDPIPSNMALRMNWGLGSPSFGAAMNYTGAVTTGEFIQVQAP